MRFRLILFISILFLVSSFAQQIQQQFYNYRVSPDVVYCPPLSQLKVQYPNYVRVTGGNFLCKSLLSEKPSVSWYSNSNRYYTLILADPDAPCHWDPKDREFLHWLVINIPGNNVGAGETVFDYVAPEPPANTGQHRYVFLVFEQPAKYMHYGSRELKDRAKFSTEQFAAEHKLGVAVAGNFLLTQH